MRGQYQHLSNLYVLRGIGGIDCHIGDIVTRQGFDACIEFGSTFGIALETDVAEVRLYQSGLQVRHADGRIGHVDAQSVGERLHSRFRGTIVATACVGSIASHRTHIDDMTVVTCHHTRHHKTRHRQQTLDICVDHR